MCEIIVSVWTDRLVAKVKLAQFSTYIFGSRCIPFVHEINWCESIPILVQIVYHRIIPELMLLINICKKISGIYYIYLLISVISAIIFNWEIEWKLYKKIQIQKILTSNYTIKLVFSNSCNQRNLVKFPFPN